MEAAEAFRATRKKAEKRIYELVNSKIDDFLDLADYDWSVINHFVRVLLKSPTNT